MVQSLEWAFANQLGWKDATGNWDRAALRKVLESWELSRRILNVSNLEKQVRRLICKVVLRSPFSPMSVSAAGTYGTVGAAGGFIRVNGNPMEQPGDKVIPPGSPYPPPGPTGSLHNHVGACSGATANRELQVKQLSLNTLFLLIQVYYPKIMIFWLF